jgi:pimeloyl-ACP methyl ester carboxylesterase
MAPVRVTGRSFEVRCAGTGPRSVMLVAGQGVTLDDWTQVQSRLGGAVRVCSYNRLGVDESDPVPEWQTFRTMADDLDGVMTALKLPRPVVVVGHSLGGPVVMSWAAGHPDAAAGVLLVDSTSTEFVEETIAQSQHLTKPLSDAEIGQQLSKWASSSDNPEHLRSRSWAELRHLPRLGDVPLVALTHSGTAMAEGFPQLDATALEAAWRAGQDHWVAASDRGRLVVVEAGHFIHRDRPEIFLQAAVDLLNA